MSEFIAMPPSLDSSVPLRPGDVVLAMTPVPGDPATTLNFIGRARSMHASAQTAPKNPAEARSRTRERGDAAWLEIDAPFRPGLVGLSDFSHIIVLGWLHQARRDLIQITRPSDTAPKGVFALRSPVRPNPVSVSVARILSVDVSTGRIEIDAIDLLDGTPLVDLKPYRPGIDAVPDAVVP